MKYQRAGYDKYEKNAYLFITLTNCTLKSLPLLIDERRLSADGDGSSDSSVRLYLLIIEMFLKSDLYAHL